MKKVNFVFALFFLIGFYAIGANAQCTCPAVNITAIPAAPYLPGSTIGLNAVIPAGYTAVSYLWTPATGLSSSTISNPILTAYTTATYCVSVNMTDDLNLIVNGDFSSGSTGFTTDYTAGMSPATAPGHYVIGDDPILYNTAWTSFGDHTTGTGKMMIIDAFDVAGKNFWCNNLTVCPNTNYRFKIWSTLVYSSPMPVIKVNINGTTTTFSPSATVGAWTSYETIWNSGVATVASICLSDTNLTINGNDFAIDDISFNKACTVDTCITINVNPVQEECMCPHIGIATTLAAPLVYGSSVGLGAIIPAGYTGSNYLWTPATGLSSDTVANPTLIVGNDSVYCVKVDVMSDSNLIVNGDFSAGIIGFTTDYSLLIPPAATYAGYYNVNTNPIIYNIAWGSFADHTTGSGNMLIVDGHYDITQNFWSDSVVVCPNSNYRFRVWSALTYNTPIPVIQVKINGSTTTFSPSVTVGNWTMYETTWNSGASTAASIRLSDLQPLVDGNDFAIDDISFNKVCTIDTCISLSVVHACYDSAYSNLSIINDYSTVDSCTYTATLTAATSNTIIGYSFSVSSGGTVRHYTSASSDSYTFTIPSGTSVTVKATVHIVDSFFECCSATFAEKVQCDGKTGCDAFDTLKTKVIGKGGDGADSCSFNLTAIGTLSPGWDMAGYLWYVNPSTTPMYSDYPTLGTPSDSRIFYFPYGFTGSITVQFIAVDKKGDTCRFFRTVFLDCKRGRVTEDKGGATAEKTSVGTIVVYPNPANNVLNISSESVAIKNIDVIDVNGKKVAAYTYDQTSHAEISLDKLAPGSYLIKVNNSVTKVVLKQ